MQEALASILLDIWPEKGRDTAALPTANYVTYHFKNPIPSQLLLFHLREKVHSWGGMSGHLYRAALFILTLVSELRAKCTSLPSEADMVVNECQVELTDSQAVHAQKRYTEPGEQHSRKQEVPSSDWAFLQSCGVNARIVGQDQQGTLQAVVLQIAGLTSSVSAKQSHRVLLGSLLAWHVERHRTLRKLAGTLAKESRVSEKRCSVGLSFNERGRNASAQSTHVFVRREGRAVRVQRGLALLITGPHFLKTCNEGMAEGVAVEANNTNTRNIVLGDGAVKHREDACHLAAISSATKASRTRTHLTATSDPVMAPGYGTNVLQKTNQPGQAETTEPRQSKLSSRPGLLTRKASAESALPPLRGLRIRSQAAGDESPGSDHRLNHDEAFHPHKDTAPHGQRLPETCDSAPDNFSVINQQGTAHRANADKAQRTLCTNATICTSPGEKKEKLFLHTSKTLPDPNMQDGVPPKCNWN
ncbi:hypothetical protein TREES_T100011713 [Tupaia chinensis]|uniref:Uncharacterized protein n=1 Tax=Tupaia chinensis TaxID=246437 RepID=L9L0M5_TUPCH|nr:hypothetical protein TREES_T100011713 [Tupaia chinensis]